MSGIKNNKITATLVYATVQNLKFGILFEVEREY